MYENSRPFPEVALDGIVDVLTDRSRHPSIHHAQHDNAATSRVNDWAVSLIASAMVR